MVNYYVFSVLKSLLLLLQLVFLGHHADSASIIKFLPGFEGPLPFELETGYIGVGEQEQIQFFYYFIKSERNPKEDPLLLWLTGGPGCSSISGLLFQNGPLTMKLDVYNGTLPSLVSTTYSWTKTSSIIFLDQPVGTGFSYYRTHDLINKPSDSGSAKLIREFLQKWQGKHQEFFSNPLYVGGDSYGGIVVPAVVQEISQGNCRCCDLPINLQGYVLGNPTSESEADYNSQIPYAHRMALISDELYESLERICKGKYINVEPSNTECLKLVKEYRKCTSRINAFFVHAPFWTGTQDCHTYRYSLAHKWVNDKTVRKALQINEESIGEWFRCNFNIPYTKDIISSIPYHVKNSIDGYRSLIYSGDHDMEVPYFGTQAWIKSLNYSIIDDWRPWIIKDQIAGYTRSYANKMTFATIKGGGHTNEYKPDESYIMFQRWIDGQPL